MPPAATGPTKTELRRAAEAKAKVAANHAIQRSCPFCHGPVPPRAGAIPGRDKTFCSRKCQQAARTKTQAQKDRKHDTNVQRVFGLAPGEYAARLEAQDGRCAICTRRAVSRRLAVDHDHNTGKVRSLLCMFCNRALGLFEFEPHRLVLLIAYAQDILDSYATEDALRDSLVATDSTGEPVLPEAVLT